MMRSKKLWALAVALTGALVFGSASQARASYSVQVYDDGVLQGGVGVLAIGNSLIFTGSTTHFSITNGSGLSNNPGSPGGSNLILSSNEQISTTFGATGGTHTIKIVLSQTDWNSPVGNPLTLSSSAGGSISNLISGSNPNAQTHVTATYQGFLANSNVLFATPAAGGTATQTATASVTGIGSNGLVFTPGISVNPTVPGGVPFSMTDVLTFTFTQDAGSGQATANVSASSVASVPAPAGLVLVLAGLPCLGIGRWLRRRKTV